ncbi:MAG: hypothetical protein HC880_09065 [Bacteroidia bacterium]|nr:hypothetical protein [Bacteroidia bacterium]
MAILGHSEGTTLHRSGAGAYRLMSVGLGGSYGTPGSADFFQRIVQFWWGYL